MNLEKKTSLPFRFTGKLADMEKKGLVPTKELFLFFQEMIEKEPEEHVELASVVKKASNPPSFYGYEMFGRFF